MPWYKVHSTLLTSIADAIRSKIGESAPILLSSMADKISNLTIGNLSGDAHTVTFMNGDTVLYEKTVLDGDDCMDVVAKGWVATPTKESTNTEFFTHAGWSLSDGGEADADALRNVTEDRTVYAAYTATTRLYTVRFFDGETLLNTMQVEYGAKADYTAEKDGFKFVEWQPSNESIVADTDCYAQWTEKITFANATFAEINEICEAGQAADYFAVGDTKDISNGAYNYTMRIVGINANDKADGSGKAGITFALSPSYFKTAYCDRIGYCFWHNLTSVYKTLHNNVLPNYLPSDLQAVIKTVKRPYGGYDPATASADSKLFLPYQLEMFAEEGLYGVAYPGLYNATDRIQYDSEGNAVAWLVADTYKTTTEGHVYLVSTDGASYTGGANNTGEQYAYNAEHHIMPLGCI